MLPDEQLLHQTIQEQSLVVYEHVYSALGVSDIHSDGAPGISMFQCIAC